jgi:hypothetical protein
MLGSMVGPFQNSITDDTFLDENVSPVPGPATGGSAPGQPTAGPASTAPPNQNVPIKPNAQSKSGYTRGSPVPLKRRVGAKGASAGKTKNGA